MNTPARTHRHTDQTTGNISAPKYFIFPINDLPHRPPLQKKKKKKTGKIPKKIHAKAIQGHVSLLNLKKYFPDDFFLQYANNVGTP